MKKVAFEMGNDIVIAYEVSVDEVSYDTVVEIIDKEDWSSELEQELKCNEDIDWFTEPSEITQLENGKLLLKWNQARPGSESSPNKVKAIQQKN